MGDRLATIDIGRKVGAAVPLSWAEADLRTKWHLDPSSCLATTDMGRKVGPAVPLFWGTAGSPSNTMPLGLRPTFLPSGISIRPAVWPQQTWAENWGLCPFFWDRAGSPSNTMRPWLKPTSTSSGISIHPTVWPQYTNVTDRTHRQDRQRSGSIGRTFYKRSPKSCLKGN